MNTESRLVKAALASVQSGKPESITFPNLSALNEAQHEFLGLACRGESIFRGPVRYHEQWSFGFGNDALLTLRGIPAGTDFVLWTVLVRYDEETETANL